MDRTKKSDDDLDPELIRETDERSPTPGLHEEVRDAEVHAQDADELELAPLDPHTEAARRRIREVDLPVPVIFVDETPPRYQFSLLHLLIANTVLAIIFAVMQAIAPSAFAGALGGIVFLAAILLTVYQPDHRGLFFAWWSLLALYVISSLVAVFGAR